MYPSLFLLRLPGFLGFDKETKQNKNGKFPLFSSDANHEVRMPGLPCVYSVAGARFLMIQAALLGGILMENVVRFSSRANGV